MTDRSLTMLGRVPGQTLVGTERLFGNVWVRLAFFSVVVLATLWPLLERAGGFNEFRDAQILNTWEWAARESLLGYGQLPLWNPYYCGGMYALGTPESRMLSPTFILTLVLGIDRAQVPTAYVMTIVGMEGFYRYVRTRTTLSIGPALAAPLFALSGFFATSFFNGWLQFYGFELLPWALYGVQRASRGETSGLCITAASFTFMIAHGGTWAILFAALFVGCEVLRQLGERSAAWRSAWRLLTCVGLAAVFSVSLAAVRVLPVLEFGRSAHRVMAGAPGNTWQALELSLFSLARPQNGNLGIEGYTYFPALVLLVAALGLLRPRAWPALALLGICVWSATGYTYGSSPFVWLRELPLFSVMRYPERWLLVAALYGAELGAVGLDVLAASAQSRQGWRALTCFALLIPGAALSGIGYAGLAENYAAVSAGMQLTPPPLVAGRDFKQARGNRWLAAYYGPLGYGTLSCMAAFELPQSEKLDGALPREEFLAESDAGRVERRRWSPNRIELDVLLSRPARLIVNQNWHPGWRTNVGQVVSDEGRIAVELPQGRHDLVLRFAPRSTLAGLLTSLAALVALVLLVRRERRGKGLTAPGALRGAVGLAATPFAVLVATSLLVPEPPSRTPALHNANGAVLLVDGLPSGARPIAAKFSLPIELRGVRLPTRADRAGNLDFELYWQVTDTVPRSLGIFVHLQDPQGRIYNADHDTVGASLLFRNAPRDKTLRDAFSVNVTPYPGEWNLYVGLWHSSGDRSQVPVISPGAGSLSGHRIKVSSFTLDGIASDD